MLTATQSTARNAVTSRGVGNLPRNVLSAAENRLLVSVPKSAFIAFTAGAKFCISSRSGFRLSNSLAANVLFVDLPILAPSMLTIPIDGESSGIRVTPSKEGLEIGARISLIFGFSALTVIESRPRSMSGINKGSDSEEKYCEIAAKRLSQKVFQFP